MKALFDQVTSGSWITSGDDVNYRIEFVETDATLLFEGTHDDFGWKMNFDFWVKAYKDQPIEWYAHRGFLTWCLPKEIEYRVRNISRWYVRGDLVTTVPWAFLGYQHVGMKHPIGPNKFPWWTHHRPVEYDTYLPV